MPLPRTALGTSPPTDHIPIDHLDWAAQEQPAPLIAHRSHRRHRGLRHQPSCRLQETRPRPHRSSRPRSVHAALGPRHERAHAFRHRSTASSTRVARIAFSRSPTASATMLPFVLEWHSGEVPGGRDPDALWRGYRQSRFSDTIWIYWKAREADAFRALWGASNFRVLTVTANDESIVNLSRKVAHITERPSRSSSCSRRHRASFATVRSPRSGTRRSTPSTTRSCATA